MKYNDKEHKGSFWSLDQAHSAKASEPTYCEETKQLRDEEFEHAKREVPASYGSGLEPKKKGGNHGK